MRSSYSQYSLVNTFIRECHLCHNISFMGFKNVPDVVSGIILVLNLCALYELDIALMGGMASQYDEPMEVEAEVRCCIV